MSQRDLFDYQFDLLTREMDTLQENIRAFDGRLVTIKGWAITVVSGIAFLALREEDFGYLIFGGFSVLAFWMIDAMNKGVQRSFIVRYNRIEHFLRVDFPSALQHRSFKGFNLPDISGRVSVRSVARKTSSFRAAFYPHTALIYGSMLFLLLGAAAWLIWK